MSEAGAASSEDEAGAPFPSATPAADFYENEKANGVQPRGPEPKDETSSSRSSSARSNLKSTGKRSRVQNDASEAEIKAPEKKKKIKARCRYQVSINARKYYYPGILTKKGKLVFAEWTRRWRKGVVVKSDKRKVLVTRHTESTLVTQESFSSWLESLQNSSRNTAVSAARYQDVPNAKISRPIIRNPVVEQGGVLQIQWKERITPVNVVDASSQIFSVPIYYDGDDGIMPTKILPVGTYEVHGANFTVHENILQDAITLAGPRMAQQNLFMNYNAFTELNTKNAVLWGVRRACKAMGKREATKNEAELFATRNIPPGVIGSVHDILEFSSCKWANDLHKSFFGEDDMTQYTIQDITMQLLFKIVMIELPKYALMPGCMAQSFDTFTMKGPGGQKFVLHNTILCFQPWREETLLIGAYCSKINVE